MCRISPVSEDWADKGCHLHVRGIEVVLRPDKVGNLVCRKWFAKDPDWMVDAASKLVFEQLNDPTWRRKLIQTIAGAMVFLLGVRGEKETRARGKLKEMRELIRTLERWG